MPTGDGSGNGFVGDGSTDKLSTAPAFLPDLAGISGCRRGSFGEGAVGGKGSGTLRCGSNNGTGGGDGASTGCASVDDMGVSAGSGGGISSGPGLGRELADPSSARTGAASKATGLTPLVRIVLGRRTTVVGVGPITASSNGTGGAVVPGLSPGLAIFSWACSPAGAAAKSADGSGGRRTSVVASAAPCSGASRLSNGVSANKCREGGRAGAPWANGRISLVMLAPAAAVRWR